MVITTTKPKYDLPRTLNCPFVACPLGTSFTPKKKAELPLQTFPKGDLNILLCQSPHHPVKYARTMNHELICFVERMKSRGDKLQKRDSGVIPGGSLMLGAGEVFHRPYGRVPDEYLTDSGIHQKSGRQPNQICRIQPE